MIGKYLGERERGKTIICGVGSGGAGGFELFYIDYLCFSLLA